LTDDNDGAVPGLDLERLARWLATAVPAAGRVRSARLLAGGKSNLTYEISDGVTSWVLRRPPLGHVLATAHDMAREYRVMSALAGTGVPVPATYAHCRDETVLGAPFYVMQKITGTPFRSAAELEPLGAARVRTISARLVDTLSSLHQVDPAAVGLADFGRAGGFLARQVRRWTAQLEASLTRPLPAAEELRRLLVASLPAESATGIVHGDYRLDNVLFDGDDRPAAVLDWEMATLGDPVTDLALLIVYRRVGDLPATGVIPDACAAPGFLTEDEIIQRYVGRGGRDPRGLGCYLGLASYKLAAILEGIHYRYLHGQTVGPGFDNAGELTEPLLDAGIAWLRDSSE
jgi:aminoglycoside phosphotransferase (APT) family kinase protein